MGEGINKQLEVDLPAASTVVGPQKLLNEAHVKVNFTLKGKVLEKVNLDCLWEIKMHIQKWWRKRKKETIWM